MANRRIGAYEVLGELGRGGMGVVYAARHVQLGRDVALKLLKDVDYATPEEAQRFQVEAQAVARLQHPGIVTVHEVGLHGRQPYLAMEYVRGESLSGLLKRGPLDPKRAASLARSLAEAMEHAHQNAILHRDLKPGNVLLDEGGQPFITDFGLAKDLSETKERLTRTGQLLGTPAYMPPEQADGQLDAIGPLSDVYSLGATLYAMLTGEPPFTGSAPMNIIAKVLTKDAKPPSALREDVPPALDTVCLKCLSKEPEDRYASAAELAADLTRFLDGDEIQGKLRRRRGRAAFLVGALSLIVALTVGAFAYIKLKSPEKKKPDDGTPEVVLSPDEQLEAIEDMQPSFARIRAFEGWMDANPGHPRFDDAKTTLREDFDKRLNEVSPTFANAGSVEWAELEGRPVLLGVGIGGLGIWAGDDLSAGEPRVWQRPDEAVVEPLERIAVEPGGHRVVLGNGVETRVRIFVHDLQAGTTTPPKRIPALWHFDALAVDWERGRVYAGGVPMKEGDPTKIVALDLDTLEPLSLPSLESVVGRIRTIAVGPNGRVAFGWERGHGGGVRLVEVRDGAAVMVAEHGASRAVNSLAFLPHGSVAVGMKDGRLVEWFPGGEWKAFAAEGLLHGFGQAHTGKVVDLELIAGGTILLSCAYTQKKGYEWTTKEGEDVPSRNLRGWWVSSRKELPDILPTISGLKPASIAVSADERRVALAARQPKNKENKGEVYDAEKTNWIELWALPRPPDPLVELKTLQELSQSWQKIAGLESWLERNPGHPAAKDVELMLPSLFQERLAVVAAPGARRLTSLVWADVFLSGGEETMGIRLWSTRTLTSSSDPAIKIGGARRVIPRPDGWRAILAGYQVEGEPAEVYDVDLSRGKIHARWTAPGPIINCLAVDWGKRRRVLVGCEQPNRKGWGIYELDPDDFGRPRKAILESDVRHGQQIRIASETGAAVVNWSSRRTGSHPTQVIGPDGKLLAEHQNGTKTRCVAISPDGKVVAVGLEGGGIYLWRVGEKDVRLLEGDLSKIEGQLGYDLGADQAHRGHPVDLTFTPSGKTLLSLAETYHDDRSLRAWDVASGKELRGIPEIKVSASAMALSSDFRRVAIAVRKPKAEDESQNRIELWALPKLD